MDTALTGAMRAFLQRLADAGGVGHRRDIGSAHSREEDRARQACCRAGYAEFRQDESDPKKRFAWHLTRNGRAALASPS